METNIIFSREFIKNELFPIMILYLEEFIDQSKINKNKDKLTLPIKSNVNPEQLEIQSNKLRKVLRKYLEDNPNLQEQVKKNFAKNLNIDVSEVDLSPWVPIDARINIPAKYEINEKKVAGKLGWHQDTGSWYNLDLQKKNDLYIKEEYWKIITYSNWIPICDCNNNGIEILENSEQFGLQNIREKLASIFDNRYYFEETITKGNIKKLNLIKYSPKAGNCIFFNSLVLHRSMKNISDEIRCSFEFRFILKKREFIKKISYKIKIKRYMFKNFPLLFKLSFLPKYMIRKMTK